MNFKSILILSVAIFSVSQVNAGSIQVKGKAADLFLSSIGDAAVKSSVISLAKENAKLICQAQAGLSFQSISHASYTAVVEAPKVSTQFCNQAGEYCKNVSGTLVAKAGAASGFSYCYTSSTTTSGTPTVSSTPSVSNTGTVSGSRK